MPRREGGERGRGLAAKGRRQRASRMKPAAVGRIGEIWRRAGKRGLARLFADPRQARHEMCGVGVHRLLEDVDRRRLLDEPARIHDPQAISDVGVHRHVVGDEQHRRAELELCVADHGEHVLLHDDVKRRRRLVGDDEFGMTEGGERDGHALLHAAGELVGIGVQHIGGKMKPLEMLLHREEKRAPVQLHVAGGEIDEGLTHPAHRVEDVHRALRDIREAPPAYRRQFRRAKGIDVAIGEGVANRSADDCERWPDGRGDGLEERRLAATRFASQSVDLVAVDDERDVVDSAHLALDAKIVHQIIGAQVFDGERRRPGRRVVLTGLGHQAAPPMRLKRLRGSMYSFIDTDRR